MTKPNPKPTGQSWEMKELVKSKLRSMITSDGHYAGELFFENFSEWVASLIKAEREEAAVEELRAIRTAYDNMESFDNGLKATGQGKKYDDHVGWMAWKGIRNVITDRIEELTGKRQ